MCNVRIATSLGLRQLGRWVEPRCDVTAVAVGRPEERWRPGEPARAVAALAVDRVADPAAAAADKEAAVAGDAAALAGDWGQQRREIAAFCCTIQNQEDDGGQWGRRRGHGRPIPGKDGTEGAALGGKGVAAVETVPARWKRAAGSDTGWHPGPETEQAQPQTGSARSDTEP